MEHRVDEIAEAVEALVDMVTVVHYDRNSDERFISCRMCHSWEDHEDSCAIPHLEQWLNMEKKYRGSHD